MNIGDKVKHISGAFDFSGTLMGKVRVSGRELLVVEQDNTRYVQMFHESSLKLIAVSLAVKRETATLGEEWFDEIVPPPPPPKPDFPVMIFVPVKAQPKNGNGGSKHFSNEVRLNYLPLKPLQSLITESVRAEIEFHFTGVSIGDIDNLLKPTLDLLKGSVIYDDSQVKDLSARFVPNSTRTGFKVKLTPYEPTKEE